MAGHPGSRGLRPATLTQYQSVVRHWVVPHIGSVPLARLTPKAIQGLYDTLRASGSTQGRGGLSARSVQLTSTVLRMALEHAVRHGLIPRNPAALVDPAPGRPAGDGGLDQCRDPPVPYRHRR